MRQIVLSCLTLFMLAACSEPAVREDAAYAMGTTVQVKVYAESFPSKHSNAVFGEIYRVGDLFENPDPYDLEVGRVLRVGEQMERATEGAFSTRLGALISLWGFDSADSRTSREPPSKTQIQRALGKRELNLYGLSKGYAIDRAAQKLRDLGYKNFVISAGGDVYVAGKRGDRNWRVAVRHPRYPQRILGHMKVKGPLALATSGDYQNYFVFEGVWFHHLLNAKTGYPARQFQQVTIMADGALMADALATALFVSGGVMHKEAFEDVGVMIMDDKGRLILNPVMKNKIVINEDAEPAHAP